MTVTPPRYWNGYRWVDLSAGGDRGAPRPIDIEIGPRTIGRISVSAELLAAEKAKEPIGFHDKLLREGREAQARAAEALPAFVARADAPMHLYGEPKIQNDPAIARKLGAVDGLLASGEAVVLEETPVAQLLQLGRDPSPPTSLATAPKVTIEAELVFTSPAVLEAVRANCGHPDEALVDIPAERAGQRPLWKCGLCGEIFDDYSEEPLEADRSPEACARKLGELDPAAFGATPPLPNPFAAAAVVPAPFGAPALLFDVATACVGCGATSLEACTCKDRR